MNQEEINDTFEFIFKFLLPTVIALGLIILSFMI
jgi:hypothetical protein